MVLDPVAELPWTVNRAARRRVHTKGGPVKRIKVERLQTVSGINMTVVRSVTAEEQTRVTAWQQEAARIMRANDSRDEKDRLPVPTGPVTDAELEVPANVISLAREFVFHSRPVNMEEAVVGADLYRKLRGIDANKAKVLELEDEEWAYLETLLHHDAFIQRYGLNAPVIVAAFNDLVPEPATSPRKRSSSSTPRKPAGRAPTPMRKRA